MAGRALAVTVVVAVALVGSGGPSGAVAPAPVGVTAAALPADAVTGLWDSGGAETMVVTATGPTSFDLRYNKLSGACPKPPGTYQASFSGSGPVYTGTWQMWWVDGCGPAITPSATFTLSADTKTLDICVSGQGCWAYTRPAPVPRFTTKDLTGADGSPRFQLDGSVSTPTDKVVDWGWDFGDGSPPTAGPVVTHSFTGTSPRSKVTLTVRHANGAIAKVSKWIDMPNRPPEVRSFDAGPPAGLVNETAFGYTVSCYDPDPARGIVKVEIEWGEFQPNVGTFTMTQRKWAVLQKAHVFTVVGIMRPKVRCVDTEGLASLWVAGPDLSVGTVLKAPKLAPGPVPGTAPSGTPVSGDFNGDHVSDLYWYAPTGTDALWLGTKAATFAVAASPRQATFAAQPVVGDFNGDGVDDIYWYGAGAATDRYWRGGRAGFTVVSAQSQPATLVPVPGDFTGDGIDDIFWYGPGAVGERLWRGRISGVFLDQAGTDLGGALVPSAGDFDGDGVDDILWYGAGAAAEVLWKGATTGTFSAGPTRDAPWANRSPVAGDFNGDGAADVYWYGSGAVTEVLWRGSYSGGFSALTPLAQGGVFTPVAGDFNGDRRADIYWFSPTSADQLFLGSV